MKSFSNLSTELLGSFIGLIKKHYTYLRNNTEIVFFICIFLLWTVLMCNENAKEGGDFSWHDLKVEANGMIFDLFVFGILVTIYNAVRARKEKIERLKEEIDDYRGWDEKEAMFRIVGAIRRLKKLNVSNIDLNSCFLVSANLRQVDLAGANLTRANLTNANFTRAYLVRANLWDANLQGANLQEAILVNADLSGANLKGANLRLTNLSNANFQGANLHDAILESAHLEGANLEGAYVGKDWFSRIWIYKFTGKERIMEDYSISNNGNLIYNKTESPNQGLRWIF